MDIVYILGTETAWHNNELKYSLRSVATHLFEVGSIIIVGSKPDFLDFSDFSPLIHIPHQDNMELTKERRIMEKVKFACQQPGISENFFFMNDDMFLLEELNAPSLPNYYKGTLLNSAKKRRDDRYKRALMNCHNALVKAGTVHQNNFDTHTPIIYNKSKFIQVMDSYDWNKPTDGYVVKSLYANSLNLEGVFQPDCKIDEPMSAPHIRDKIKDRLFFSVGDFGLNEEMKNVLQELYPEKSPWEI